MKRTKYTLLLFLLFFSSSCENSTTEIETKEFLNTLWKLEAFEIDGEIITPPVEQNYNIKFQSESTFVGKSACNDIGGNYKLEGENLLIVSKLGTTFANCGEGSFYGAFYSAVHKLSSYYLHNNRLTLFYGNNSKLIFKAE